MDWDKHEEVKLVHEVKQEVCSTDEARRTEHTEKSDQWLAEEVSAENYNDRMLSACKPEFIYNAVAILAGVPSATHTGDSRDTPCRCAGFKHITNEPRLLVTTVVLESRQKSITRNVKKLMTTRQFLYHMQDYKVIADESSAFNSSHFSKPDIQRILTGSKIDMCYASHMTKTITSRTNWQKTWIIKRIISCNFKPATSNLLLYARVTNDKYIFKTIFTIAFTLYKSRHHYSILILTRLSTN